VSLFQFLETIPRQKKLLLNSSIESGSILLTPEQSLNRGGNSLDLQFTHQSDQGGTAVVAKNSQPFFTCRQPGEGIEGILPDKGCGLPSPSRKPIDRINNGIEQ